MEVCFTKAEQLTNQQVRVVLAVHSYDAKYAKSLEAAKIDVSAVLKTNYEVKAEGNYRSDLKLPGSLVFCNCEGFNPSDYLPTFLSYTRLDECGESYKIFRFISYSTETKMVAIDYYELAYYKDCADDNPAILTKLDKKSKQLSIADTMRTFGLTMMRLLADQYGWDELIKSIVVK